jgi:uncharacterized protein (TIGR02594 family)
LTTPDVKWMDRAKQEMGITEVPGREDNPRIEEYLTTTDTPLPRDYSDEVAWCSAFVNWNFKQEGIKGTGSAWSQSWREWGKGLSDPKFGCVVVFHWSGIRGHVGFVWDWDNEGIFVLGGNQHNSVNITYFRYDNVVAYRWPKGV